MEVAGFTKRSTAIAALAGILSRIVRSPAPLAAGVIALAGCGSAPTDAPTDPGAREPAEVGVQTGETTSIFGGSQDNDASAVSGVVALRVGTGGTFELCTGALLAPNVVLTARHCVTQNVTTTVSCDEDGRSDNGQHVAGDQPPENVGIYVGAAPTFASRPDAIAKAIISPKGDYLCDSDIAIIVLDRDLPGLKPLAVRLSTPALAGEMIRSVGYGQNDDKLPIGTRFRKTDVKVLAQGKAISASKTPLGQHEFEVGESICQGDSGGPAISEETGAVIGVVSRGGQCDDDFGHIYTTTAGFDDVFAEAFQIAGGQPTLESGTPDATASASTDDTSAPSTQAGCSVALGDAGAGGSGAGAFAVALGLAAVAARRGRRRR